MNKDEIERLERLIGQMDSLHNEVAALAKKNANDLLNEFKLKFVNQLLDVANNILQDSKPLEGFSLFEEVKIPSNSDVTLILSQYMSALEQYRSENIHIRGGVWVYKIDGSDERIRTMPPASLSRKK